MPLKQILNICLGWTPHLARIDWDTANIVALTHPQREGLAILLSPLNSTSLHTSELYQGAPGFSCFSLKGNHKLPNSIVHLYFSHNTDGTSKITAQIRGALGDISSGLLPYILSSDVLHVFPHNESFVTVGSHFLLFANRHRHVCLQRRIHI